MSGIMTGVERLEEAVYAIQNKQFDYLQIVLGKDHVVSRWTRDIDHSLLYSHDQCWVFSASLAAVESLLKRLENSTNPIPTLNSALKTEFLDFFKMEWRKTSRDLPDFLNTPVAEQSSENIEPDWKINPSLDRKIVQHKIRKDYPELRLKEQLKIQHPIGEKPLPSLEDIIVNSKNIPIFIENLKKYVNVLKKLLELAREQHSNLQERRDAIIQAADKMWEFCVFSWYIELEFQSEISPRLQQLLKAEKAGNFGKKYYASDIENNANNLVLTTPLIKELVKPFFVDINALVKGKTLLTHAVLFRDPEMVDYLTRYNPSPNIPDENGVTSSNWVSVLRVPELTEKIARYSREALHFPRPEVLFFLKETPQLNDDYTERVHSRAVALQLKYSENSNALGLFFDKITRFFLRRSEDWNMADKACLNKIVHACFEAWVKGHDEELYDCLSNIQDNNSEKLSGCVARAVTSLIHDFKNGEGRRVENIKTINETAATEAILESAFLKQKQLQQEEQIANMAAQLRIEKERREKNEHEQMKRRIARKREKRRLLARISELEGKSFEEDSTAFLTKTDDLLSDNTRWNAPDPFLEVKEPAVEALAVEGLIASSPPMVVEYVICSEAPAPNGRFNENHEVAMLCQPS